MILYKYMSDPAAKAVLENQSIGFSKPDQLNDPYELRAAYPPYGGDERFSFIHEVQSYGKYHIWSSTSGVLSLTRNPLNPLMWAHYGDEHKGVVLGIDMKKAGFFDTQRCLIPAQFGSVIYSQTRPTHPFPVLIEEAKPISVGHTHHYPFGHEEKLQRIFLQKPSCWSYEEEVRVVKCLSDREGGESCSGSFNEVDLGDKIIYCYRLPEGSIKEVYVGMRNNLLSHASCKEDVVSEYRDIYPSLEVNFCRISRTTWDIESINVSR